MWTIWSMVTPNRDGNFAAVYNYFDNGNVSKAQFHNPQNQITGHDRYHWNFGYDGLKRLTSADYGSGASTASGFFDVTGLSYDAAGNLTGLQRDDETGSLIDNLTYNYVNGTNRLGSVSDVIGATVPGWDAEDATFSYDAGGNLTSQTGKLSNVAYDHRNLPIHFTLTSGGELVANYNADGQRILKETSSGTWQFYVMDGSQTLAVIDQNGFSHFNLVGNSTFGRWEPSGARRYYISDHLGSTRAVVDDQGNVLETFDYYPFGLLMPKRGTTSGNTLEKFTGKERDEAIGLDYFGARYYDAAIGRWHSVDPLADEYSAWSPYNYTLNDPINLVDPDGNCPMPSGDPFCIGLRQGFQDAVTSTLEGIGNLFSDPVGTAKGIGNALANPGQTFDAIKEGVGERVDMATSGNPFQMGQVAGEGIALAGEALLGTKGAGSLAKGTRLLKATDDASDLSKAFHFTPGKNAESIATTGIRSGRGTVFATPNSTLSPLQAQIDLALPPNRGLPNAVFEIDLGGLRKAGVQISQPRQVGRNFNMPGGGQEILIKGNVPPEFLKRINQP